MWRVRRIQDRTASVFLTPKRDEAENTQTEPRGCCEWPVFTCYLYFRSHQELRQLPSLGNVRVTCPGKEPTGPTSWTESVGSPGWPAHKAKGSGPRPHSMQQRKMTQDVSGAAKTCQGDRTSSVFRIPAGRGGHQGLSRLLLLAPGSNQLSPHHWHQGFGCIVPGPPPTLLSANTEGVWPHGHSPPSNLLPWLRTTHHRDYLPLPPSLDTSNRSSHSQHAFSTDLPWTTPGPGHQDPQVLLPLPG